MAILGGSPLGLINVTAGAYNGYTSFNNDSGRGTNVDAYNGYSQTGVRKAGNSLFSGHQIVRGWPEMGVYRDTTMPGAGGTFSVGFQHEQGDVADYRPRARRALHNNDVYDTSIVNIIQHLRGTMGTLKMADFAYLKDVGVYSNNRLMIARRFGNAVGDNIFRNFRRNKEGAATEPVAFSTLISWVPEGTDFLTISFGEKWEDAKATFKDILDQIGADVSSKLGSLGSVMESVGGALPLPGFTEVFQREFLKAINVLDDNAPLVPSGNPNLIKEAKRRTTVGYDTAGSGLDCKVSIAMTCEYEQKFISGLDPTVVWMDILGKVTRFGTSPSVKYGLSGAFASAVASALNDPMGFVVHVIQQIKTALLKVASTIKDELKKKVDEINSSLKKLAEKNQNRETANAGGGGGNGSPGSSGNTGQSTEEQLQEEEETGLKDEIKAIEKKAAEIAQKILSYIERALKGLAYKYRVEIMGVVHALTGMPSTPWHITIGNPLRPVFCAGDMLTQEVTLTLGPTLAFNDLPSSIKVNFTLTNARPWGLQEIMAKFNSGYIRTVDVQKSFFETAVVTRGKVDIKEDAPPLQVLTEAVGSFPGDSNIVDEARAENQKKIEAQQQVAIGLSPSVPTGVSPSNIVDAIKAGQLVGGLQSSPTTEVLPLIELPLIGPQPEGVGSGSLTTVNKDQTTLTPQGKKIMSDFGTLFSNNSKASGDKLVTDIKNPGSVFNSFKF